METAKNNNIHAIESPLSLRIACGKALCFQDNENMIFMSLEENKTLVLRFIDAYNERRLDLIDDFIASDYFDHTNKVDREGLKQLFASGLKAFPDWHETVEDIIAEDDKVWVRLAYAGTHEGDFMGLSPTGKRITSKAVDMYRIADGKLAEYWNVTDRINILKQVGAVEATEKGKRLFPEEVN